MPFGRLVVSLLAATLSGCGGSTAPNPIIEGPYTATTFRVVPQGQALIDVLAAGGSLSITIAPNGTTTGTLNVPASAAGGTAFTASMAGTAVLTGSTVRFTQNADSFVRNLDRTVSGKTLSVQGLTAGSGTFTITLTRP